MANASSARLRVVFAATATQLACGRVARGSLRTFSQRRSVPRCVVLAPRVGRERARRACAVL
eukprot:11200797-Lingulodinium_polyedra.AAC.1